VLSQAWAWVVDRFGLGPIWDQVLDRPVPRSPWYHGDGMALMVLLTILVVTGVCLSLSYCPAMDEAYASVQYITQRQLLGWFIRGLHYWSAGLMVVMLFVHLCRQLILAGYKSPREATWLVGVFLLFIVLTTSLLGYILRWDERGHEGLRVALSTFRSVPLIGHDLVMLVQGGPDVTSLTLTRLFAMHVVVLPLLLFVLIGYHLYLVILQGTTTLGERKEPIETVEEQRELYEEQAESPRRGEVFFPTAVIKISPWSIVMVSAALGLTLTVGPRELMEPANLTASSAASEEWWFAWYSGLIALLPPRAAATFRWLFPVVTFLLLIALPFVDRGPYRGWRSRPVATTLVVVLVLSVLGLSWLRFQSPWTGRPSAAAPAVPLGLVLSEEAERGRMLFPQHGCASCHAVAGSGLSHVGSDLARVDHFYSQAELHRYILHPPPNVAMPAYAGRLTDEDLDDVVAFVLVAQTFPRKQE
jgi:ubiquinol-cytochrome c reductase cytochrome b subunit